MACTVCAATWFVARIDPSRGVNLARHSLVTTSSRDPISSTVEHLTDGDPWDPWHPGVTTREEDRPWLMLDLDAEKTVSRVVVYNCLDCVETSNTPLALELSRDARSFSEVGRRDQPFELWELPTSPRRARFVRLHLLLRGRLQLREVEVY
jgi:hypothetical protein